MEQHSNALKVMVIDDSKTIRRTAETLLMRGRARQPASHYYAATATEGAMNATALRYASAAGFDDVVGIVQGRCSMCHATEPGGFDGITRAPKGVHLENPAQIARAAHQIYVQAGLTHAMPPGNLSFMEAAERKAIRDWYEAATRG